MKLSLLSSLLVLSAFIQASQACPPGQQTPSRTSINTGFTSPEESFMKTFFGNPIVPTPSSPPTDCYSQSAITNPKLKQLLITENVGPFSVTGLKPVIDTLKKIFAEVEKKDPKLYSQLSNEGMLCVRPKKKNGKYRMGTWSNHAWGAAIDIRTKTQDDKQGDNCTLPELSKLYPYFHQEGFYWGAGYSSTEDSMHFEASTELLQKWRTQGLL